MYVSQYLFINSFRNFSPEQNLYLTFSRLRRLQNLPLLHIRLCRLTRSFHLPRLKKLNELFPIYYHGKLEGLKGTINYLSSFVVGAQMKNHSNFLASELWFPYQSTRLRFPYTFRISFIKCCDVTRGRRHGNCVIVAASRDGFIQFRIMSIVKLRFKCNDISLATMLR